MIYASPEKEIFRPRTCLCATSATNSDLPDRHIPRIATSPISAVSFCLSASGAKFAAMELCLFQLRRNFSHIVGRRVALKFQLLRTPPRRIQRYCLGLRAAKMCLKPLTISHLVDRVKDLHCSQERRSQFLQLVCLLQHFC